MNEFFDIPGKLLFRASEIAELLNCSTRTVNRWANAGEFGELWQKGKRGRKITRPGLVAFLQRYKEDWGATGQTEGQPF